MIFTGAVDGEEYWQLCIRINKLLQSNDENGAYELFLTLIRRLESYYEKTHFGWVLRLINKCKAIQRGQLTSQNFSIIIELIRKYFHIKGTAMIIKINDRLTTMLSFAFCRKISEHHS